MSGDDGVSDHAHVFEFLRSDFTCAEDSSRVWLYTQRDFFFCKLCLQYRTITAHEERNAQQPGWYKPK